MIYAVCGPISPHQMLVTHLAKAVVERRHGSILLCATNDAVELRTMVARRRGEACLLVFDTPDDVISSLVLRGGMPTAFVLEPFTALAAFAWNFFGGSFEDGYRAVTRSLSALRPIAMVANAAPIRVGDGEDIAAVLNRICSCFDYTFKEDELEVIITAFRDYYSTSNVLDIAKRLSHHTEAARHTASQFTMEQKDLLRRLAKSYEEVLRPRNIQSLHWPVETLTNAEAGSPLAGPIELTGPGRLLTFGPYLHIPKGRWEVILTFSTIDNTSGNIFMVDVYSPTSQKVLAVGCLDLPVSGTFSTFLSIEIQSPLHALEVRTFMPTGAIEGVLELLDVSWRTLE